MSQNPSIENGAVWELAVGSGDNNSEVRSQEGSLKVYQKLHESLKKVCVIFENRESGGLLATLQQDLLFVLLTQFLTTPM